MPMDRSRGRLLALAWSYLRNGVLLRGQAECGLPVAITGNAMPAIPARKEAEVRSPRERG